MGGRGRKKGSDGEKSREILLKIAAEEFALQGYHATKISTIVKKADVTQPTFYLYFKSKDAIFQELVDLFGAKLATLTEESRLIPGIEPQLVQDCVIHGLGAIFRFLVENEHIARIGFIVSEDAFEIKEKMTKQIKRNLAVKVKEGYFHSDVELSTVADAIVGMIEHLTQTKLWTGLKAPDELSKEIAQLFLYGLKAKIIESSI